MPEQFIAWFQQSAQTEIFGGLAAVSMLGYAVYVLRAVPQYAFKFWKRTFTTELTVRSDDQMFVIIAQWLGKQNFVTRSRRLKLLTKSRSGAFRNRPAIDGDDEDTPEYLFVPAPGWHYFWYKARPVLLHIDDGQEKKADDGFMIIEHITMRTYGRRSTLFHSMMLEALEEIKSEKRIRVATYERYGGWNNVTGKLPRSLKSVITTDNVGEDVLADMTTFFNSQKWYVERGIPWRRGYMFEGPPGTGKSSLVFALASEMSMPIYSLSFGSVPSGELSRAVANVPEKSILLIEDVDTFSLTKKRDENEDKESDKMHSLSDLLNALDGVAAGEGRAVVMTTNHPEKLDAALTRAGRIDRRVHLDYFGREEALQMWRLFFQPGRDFAEQVLMNQLPERVQPARLQEHLTKYRNDPDLAAYKALDLA